MINFLIRNSDAKRLTINYGRFWNFQIILDNAKDFDRLC